MDTKTDPDGPIVDVYDPTETVQFLVIEDSTSLPDLPEAAPAVVHRKKEKKQPVRERMLHFNDPLRRELYDLQRHIPDWDRKNLATLTYADAVTYRDELKSRVDEIQQERKAEFGAAVRAEVASVLESYVAEAAKVTENRPVTAYVAGMDRLDSVLDSSKEKERKLEAEYAKSLATLEGGLDAAKQANQDLLDQHARERAALEAKIPKATSPGVVEAGPVVVTARREKAPIDQASRFSMWQVSLWWLYVTLVLGALAVLLVWVFLYVSTLSAKTDVSAENENSQPQQNTLSTTRQQRSTPTFQEIEADGQMTKLRGVINKSNDISQPKGSKLQ